MREQGQTSTRESARDILLDWLRLRKTRSGTELRYQAGKRQVNEPKAACEQPVIPFAFRKSTGEHRANSFLEILVTSRLGWKGSRVILPRLKTWEVKFASR